MAQLINTKIRGFIGSGKRTGQTIVNRLGESVPEIVSYFKEGFDGHGWRIWTKKDGKTKLECDEVTVRGSFSVFELLVQKIRAVKGALVISQASGKIATVKENGDYYDITLEDEDMCFVADDLIMKQRFSNEAAKVEKYYVKAESVDGSVIRIKKSEFADTHYCTAGAAPKVGDEIVQMGNTTNKNRQNAIYIHANETEGASVDVKTGIDSKDKFNDSPVVQLGGLMNTDEGQEANGLYCLNGTIKSVNGNQQTMYELNPDGSGSLANKQIKWDKYGNLTIDQKGQEAAKAYNIVPSATIVKVSESGAYSVSEITVNLTVNGTTTLDNNTFRLEYSIDGADYQNVALGGQITVTSADTTIAVRAYVRDKGNAVAQITIPVLRDGNTPTLPDSYTIVPSATIIRVSKDEERTPQSLSFDLYKNGNKENGDNWKLCYKVDGGEEEEIYLSDPIDGSTAQQNIVVTKVKYAPNGREIEAANLPLVVPVVKDGQDGKSIEGKAYSIVPSATIIKVDKYDNYSETQLTVSLTENGVPMTLANDSSTGYQIYYKIDDGSTGSTTGVIDLSTKKPKSRVQLTGHAKTDSGWEKVAALTIPVLRDGAQGKGFAFNLLHNGNFAKGKEWWQNNAVKDFDVVESDGKKWAHTQSDSTDKGAGFFQKAVNIVGGKTYTLSATVKGDRNATQALMFYLPFNKGDVQSKFIDISTTAQRMIYTFTAPTGCTFVDVVLVDRQESPLMEFWATDIKLEEGTEATEWAPHIDEMKGEKGDSTDGKDGYTWVVSPQSLHFVSDDNGAVDTSTLTKSKVEITCYQGTTQQRLILNGEITVDGEQSGYGYDGSTPTVQRVWLTSLKTQTATFADGTQKNVCVSSASITVPLKIDGTNIVNYVVIPVTIDVSLYEHHYRNSLREYVNQFDAIINNSKTGLTALSSRVEQNEENISAAVTKVNGYETRISNVEVKAEGITTSVSAASQGNLLIDGAFEMPLDITNKRKPYGAKVDKTVTHNGYNSERVDGYDYGGARWYGLLLEPKTQYTFSCWYRAEKMTPGTYSVEAVSNAQYGFSQNASGYYESRNKGVNSSYAICKVVVNLTSECNVIFHCISSGENNYDYGLLSEDDTALALSNTADTSGVAKSFKGESSTDVKDYTYEKLTAGTHTIYAKYIKDSGGAGGNDSLQFKVEIVATAEPRMHFEALGVTGNSYNVREGQKWFIQGGDTIKEYGTWKEFKCTFTTLTGYDTVEALAFVLGGARLWIAEPMLNVGTVALPFRQSATGLAEVLSSMFEMLANKIAFGVYDALKRRTGIDVLNGKIRLIAGNVGVYADESDEHPYISFERNDDSSASLWFYNGNGEKLYDLGMTGLTEIIQSSVHASFSGVIGRKVADKNGWRVAVVNLAQMAFEQADSLYRFTAAMTVGDNNKPIYVGGGENYNGKGYNTDSMNTAKTLPANPDTFAKTGLYFLGAGQWSEADDVRESKDASSWKDEHPELMELRYRFCYVNNGVIYPSGEYILLRDGGIYYDNNGNNITNSYVTISMPVSNTKL